MPTFLNPWLLAGGAAVSIPIVVHFFFKARYKPLPWAAMKFLREAIEQTSRRLKFQEWILLALRCLVILLLALALARPGMMTAGSSGRGEAIDAVLVLDNSYSMGAQDGDKTRLDRARDAALQVIDSLPANSTVQVYTCSDRAALLGPVSRSNLDQARELVKTVRLSALATDLLPGVTEALKAVDTGSSPSKEVYVFSDLHKLGFEQQPGALRARCDELKGRANLVFVRCGKADRRVANVAVVDVHPVGLIPHTNTRLPFVVTLKNTGTEPVKGVKVGLELDGVAVTSDVASVDVVEPGQSLPVTLTGEFGPHGGPRLLTARVSGDGLPGDNRFDKLILVRDRVRVLVVDGDITPDNPDRFGGDFVEVGLNPTLKPLRFRVREPRVGEQAEYFVKPEVRLAREASAADLAGKELVFLCNVPVPLPGRPASGVSQDFVDRLGEFVRNGGGLVIGLGPNVELADTVDAPDGTGKQLAPYYNRVLGSGGANLLPFDLAVAPGGVVEAAPAGSPFNPAPDTIDGDSFLAPFKEAPFSSIFREIRVTKMARLALPPVGSPEWANRSVLARTADQRPFVVSRTVGDGQVVMLTTTFDERWTDFPGIRGDAFVSFVQFTVAHLSGRKVPGGNQTAGQPIVWYPPEATGNFELVLPPRPDETSPRRVRLGPAGAPAPDQRLRVTASDTSESGVYRVVKEGTAPAPVDPVYAVNPDLRESANLDVAADADLATWLGYSPVVIQAGANTEAAVNQVRARREWTEWLLLGLLLLLLGESAWAWVCGKAW
ncbi:MAG: BatA domain-containing protein [Gemmataceae bacterium]|nr:BatA domain-containing protein [Gemmataceae bacterium]